jgi:hypothetical protein
MIVRDDIMLRLLTALGTLPFSPARVEPKMLGEALGKGAAPSCQINTLNPF